MTTSTQSMKKEYLTIQEESIKWLHPITTSNDIFKFVNQKIEYYDIDTKRGEENKKEENKSITIASGIKSKLRVKNQIILVDYSCQQESHSLEAYQPQFNINKKDQKKELYKKEIVSVAKRGKKIVKSQQQKIKKPTKIVSKKMDIAEYESRLRIINNYFPF